MPALILFLLQNLLAQGNEPISHQTRCPIGPLNNDIFVQSDNILNTFICCSNYGFSSECGIKACKIPTVTGGGSVTYSPHCIFTHLKVTYISKACVAEINDIGHKIHKPDGQNVDSITVTCGENKSPQPETIHTVTVIETTCEPLPEIVPDSLKNKVSLTSSNDKVIFSVAEGYSLNGEQTVVANCVDGVFDVSTLTVTENIDCREPEYDHTLIRRFDEGITSTLFSVSRKYIAVNGALIVSSDGSNVYSIEVFCERNGHPSIDNINAEVSLCDDYPEITPETLKNKVTISNCLMESSSKFPGFCTYDIDPGYLGNGQNQLIPFCRENTLSVQRILITAIPCTGPLITINGQTTNFGPVNGSASYEAPQGTEIIGYGNAVNFYCIDENTVSISNINLNALTCPKSITSGVVYENCETTSGEIIMKCDVRSATEGSYLRVGTSLLNEHPQYCAKIGGSTVAVPTMTLEMATCLIIHFDASKISLENSDCVMSGYMQGNCTFICNHCFFRETSSVSTLGYCEKNGNPSLTSLTPVNFACHVTTKYSVFDKSCFDQITKTITSNSCNFKCARGTQNPSNHTVICPIQNPEITVEKCVPNNCTVFGFEKSNTYANANCFSNGEITASCMFECRTGTFPDGQIAKTKSCDLDRQVIKLEACGDYSTISISSIILFICLAIVVIVIAVTICICVFKKYCREQKKKPTEILSNDD